MQVEEIIGSLPERLDGKTCIFDYDGTLTRINTGGLLQARLASARLKGLGRVVALLRGLLSKMYNTGILKINYEYLIARLFLAGITMGDPRLARAARTVEMESLAEHNRIPGAWKLLLETARRGCSICILSNSPLPLHSLRGETGARIISRGSIVKALVVPQLYRRPLRKEGYMRSCGGPPILAVSDSPGDLPGWVPFRVLVDPGSGMLELLS
ncbi:MAG: haloacid dehalogenase-like hydrolase [Desulfurococcales archaeon]|nr:haloacid dehalogenase-like hydrolase [Desulfurococcales archaeon]